MNIICRVEQVAIKTLLWCYVFSSVRVYDKINTFLSRVSLGFILNLILNVYPCGAVVLAYLHPIMSFPKKIKNKNKWPTIRS